ncbi:hypothetical protein Tco_1421055 [Tanacetum coccineum]
MLIVPNALKMQKRAFKFANFITDKLEFLQIVKDNWDILVKGCKMFKLMKRTKNMKKHMKKLAWKKGNLFCRTDECKEKIKNIQSDVDGYPHNVDGYPHNVELRIEESNALKEYCKAVCDEEKFLYQQAKIDWLKDGDRNSKFFHAYLKSRRNKSRISMINNEIGESFSEEKVPEQFVMHFKKFLRKAQPTQLKLLENISFDKFVSENDAEWMIRPVSTEEIKRAMFDIDGNRAPWPDGFSSKFYKQSWEFIGKDVCDNVQDFFNKGKMLGEINATSISLIPKMETPIKVSDFRPIAYCNVIYKCISKILTERIKNVVNNKKSLANKKDPEVGED